GLRANRCQVECVGSRFPAVKCWAISGRPLRGLGLPRTMVKHLAEKDLVSLIAVPEWACACRPISLTRTKRCARRWRFWAILFKHHTEHSDCPPDKTRPADATHVRRYSQRSGPGLSAGRCRNRPQSACLSRRPKSGLRLSR